MNYRPLVVIAVCSIVVSINFTSASAQSGRNQLTATSESQADADFWVMGEYIGLVQDRSVDPSDMETYGLQVVALGDGSFDGVLFPNGLPGNGASHGSREKLSGKRQNGRVMLVNDRWDIEIGQGNAVLMRRDGAASGSLPKVLRRSRSLGAAPPPEALVLFDGTNVEAFRNGKMVEGLLQIGTEINPQFRDFTLHLEFKVPYMPYARDQGRGNSGVYLHSRYEVQILDSFGLEGAFNECGSLYRYQPPRVNMAFPPLSWQTYDITFQSARFDADGNKTRNANLTVVHNGVPVHCQFVVERKTGAGNQEGPKVLPTKLQDHGNPVEFRNIWIVDHTDRPVPLNVGTICIPQGF